ncbi:MAG TPA: RNase adapter RapZ [Microthrixaceae bacterium]|nr:RNase adapter RapZ [Microthrixaceae bacterium]RTL06945.1 MAG: RNase adapter RapZ [Acidimicrobiia bacterium]MCB9399980.1 RNase adapter RapZ [Microthrixaceae bacterium]HMU80365.1 RNase adapter RapZ [Microthrixaceae bacterium]HMV74616.1 RNase adapter RapZ [Microthrixaceae bacterium]
MSEFVVITGVSGAGRTQFGDSLEDLGWFVIDNIPVELIPKVAELARFKERGTPVALVVGSGGDLAEIGPALDELRGSGAGVRIVFLDASTPTLVRRYGESKRRHPLAAQAGTVAGAIDLEREVLAEVRQAADIVIDTSELNVHDLRSRVNDLFAESDGSRMQVTLQSFGFKHGVPADVDTVFDCRFLPNPYWIDELRDLTGLDPAVQDYVRSMGLTGEFLRRIEDLFDLLLPAYVAEGKSLLTIGFGCTGGHHRSVTIVETVAEWLRSKGIEPRVRHRDISK